jgi:hypothetical protein
MMVLFVEGSTDTRFLGTLIRRAAEKVISKHEIYNVEIPENLEVVERKRYDHLPNEKDRILEAAKRHSDYDILVTHFDADSSSNSKALKEHFEPAYQLIEAKRAAGENMCNKVLPIIPIRNIEAWMLADIEALRTVLNTKDLKLSAKSVENITDPKGRLKEILWQINEKRSANQTIKPKDLYGPLGKEINLEILEQATAYQKFIDDLTKALQATGFIR